MNLDNLIHKLSKKGTVQLCKEGYVFTLLMTGKKLDNWQTVYTIQQEVVEYVGEKYPLIECMRNDEYFLCLVLRHSSINLIVTKWIIFFTKNF